MQSPEPFPGDNREPAVETAEPPPPPVDPDDADRAVGEEGGDPDAYVPL